ncbi:Gldg family protein [Thalassolituus alkanivorans]|uniref:Gldg family protein n=1 Tax=Thalassolituus alkanivorans TaxID=2881055 RepID=UPI001E31204E|nr:Gldg family protein [Thalassolituus alkanivorans]MCB2386146.1 Gldg family protein [Thalassolituus alkanivorans]MCB2422844.1 Gldg family protein [Thalassolituus alkanivorans]
MKFKLFSLLALLLGFIGGAFLLNQLGSGARLDLTEQKLYTLSEGTRNILAQLNQPVELELYFSQKASADLVKVRAYQQRVRELLDEYVMLAGGKLSLKIIDPAPFSEEEDQATAYGLQAVPVSVSGDNLYFGLVAKAQLPQAAENQSSDEKAADAGKEQVAQLPFLQPDREAFLEYEITQLIYQVQQSKPVVIGLLSGLDVRGGFNPQTGRPAPAWMAIDQLDGPYELRSLTAGLDHIDDDIDLLLLVQPPELTDSALYAIDQFALKGGRVLAFLDPVAETAPNGGLMGMGDSGSASSLNKLLQNWGVGWNPDQVVLDAANALVVNQGPGRPPLRHFGLLALHPESLNADDVVTAQLEAINLSSVGHFTALENALSSIEPWLYSSTEAMLTDANRLRMGGDLMALQRDFVPANEEFNLAVRVQGKADSAFPDGVDGVKTDTHLASTERLAVTLVADTDVLSDRLWVQVQNFFGQRIASPWADNGALLVNLADHLGGSADLISLRARGQYNRPFERVNTLRRDAEQQFLASEQRLQQELEETEQQLSALQDQRDGDNGVLTLSAEQQAALEQFQQKKIEIRKELRNVQHELDKDIEALGMRLKVLNIFVLPLLFTLLLWALVAWQRRRQSL